MNRLATCTHLLLALALVLALPAAADDGSALRAGRAWALAHASLDAWTSATGERDSTSVSALRLDFFAFAGSARLAAERFSDPGLRASEARVLLSSLEDLAGGCQNSMDRARVGSATRDAWADTRRALASLVDGAPVRANDRPAAREPEPEPEAPAAEPETRVDPDAPRAVISETRWSGTFTPDLVISGRLEGRGIRTGSLVLKNSSGREVFRSEKIINDAIAAATQGGARDALATATFSVRIDDDDLASGENTIVLTVTDSRGRRSEATTSVTKRLF